MDDLLLISEVFRFPRKRFYWQTKLHGPRLYLLDWRQKRIVKRIAPPPAFFDREEYRSLRLCYHYSGARGIISSERHVYVALQNAIAVYDRGLQKQVGRIDHRLFNGIHEIVWHRDRLYVTCAVTDAVLTMSADGGEMGVCYLGNNPVFLERFGLAARELDNRLDYRIMHRAQRLFHVNNVAVRDGAVYAHFNRQGSFVMIHPRQEVIVHDPTLLQSHNGQFTPDGRHILIIDTGHNALRVYDSAGTPVRAIDFRGFPLPVDFLREKTFGNGHAVKAGWLRGLAFSASRDDVAYIGFSPAMVIAVDYIRGEFIDCLPLRRNMCFSVHGLHNLSAAR